MKNYQDDIDQTVDIINNAAALLVEITVRQCIEIIKEAAITYEVSTDYPDVVAVQALDNIIAQFNHFFCIED